MTDLRHWQDAAVFARRAALELDHLMQPNSLGLEMRDLLEHVASLLDEIPRCVD